jgi:hypothetical protein
MRSRISGVRSALKWTWTFVVQIPSWRSIGIDGAIPSRALRKVRSKTDMFCIAFTRKRVVREGFWWVISGRFPEGNEDFLKKFGGMTRFVRGRVIQRSA